MKAAATGERVSMGMMDRDVMRWQEARQRADAAKRRAGDRHGRILASAAKIVRRVMQSILLAAGALLVMSSRSPRA